jgi:hypothetical protein
MCLVFENSKYFENYDEFERIDRLWAGHGLAAALPPISVSPLQKLLARWAGVEKTVELYMENNEEFEEILGRIGTAEDEVFEIIADSPSLYVEFAENLSSEITGRNFFVKYNLPYYRRRIEQLHKKGKFAGIHIDGTLGSCLPLLADCGFDVAEAVTPAPVGDVEVENLRKTAGENIVIWGGLPGALFSPLYTEKQFVEHLKKVLDVFVGDSRFVLGVADQVPPDGLISRVRLVREMVDSQRNELK